MCWRGTPPVPVPPSLAVAANTPRAAATATANAVASRDRARARVAIALLPLSRTEASPAHPPQAAARSQIPPRRRTRRARPAKRSLGPTLSPRPLRARSVARSGRDAAMQRLETGKALARRHSPCHPAPARARALARAAPPRAVSAAATPRRCDSCG